MGVVCPKTVLLVLLAATEAILVQHVAVRYSTFFRLREILIAAVFVNLLAWAVYTVFIYPRLVSPLRNVPDAKVFP